jgi:O-antigen/teichoic acid export membrane protein
VTQRLIAVIGTFLVYPRVLHALGTDQFGVWGATTSLVMLVIIADFGVGPAIVTLVSHALATGKTQEPREHFTAALMAACGISILIASAGSLFCFLVVPRSELVLYLIAVTGVAINVPLGAASAAWLALQRGWMLAFWDFLQNVLFVIGLAAATLFTHDVRVFVAAVYGALLAANVANLWSLMVRHPELRPAGLSASLAQIGIVLRTGSRYFALSALDALSYLFDNTIALQMLGPVASAKMAVVQRICLPAIGLLMVVAQPLWPAFVEAATRNDRSWIFRALAGGTLLVTGAAVAGSCVIVIFGHRLLKLWLGADLGIGAPLLWAMAGWIVSFSLVRVQVLLLNALRIVDFQIAVFGVATLIALALKFALAPTYGISGILMATAVTFPVVILPAIAWRIGLWRRSDSGKGLISSELRDPEGDPG